MPGTLYGAKVAGLQNGRHALSHFLADVLLIRLPRRLLAGSGFIARDPNCCW